MGLFNNKKKDKMPPSPASFNQEKNKGNNLEDLPKPNQGNNNISNLNPPSLDNKNSGLDDIKNQVMSSDNNQNQSNNELVNNQTTDKSNNSNIDNSSHSSGDDSNSQKSNNDNNLQENIDLDDDSLFNLEELDLNTNEDDPQKDENQNFNNSYYNLDKNSNKVDISSENYFITTKEFKTLLESIDYVKKKVKEASETHLKLMDLKSEENIEYENLRKDFQYIEEKLYEVDSLIFDK